MAAECLVHGRCCDWHITLFLLICIMITRSSGRYLLLGMRKRFRGEKGLANVAQRTPAWSWRVGDPCQVGVAPSPFMPHWPVSVPTLLTEDFLALCPRVLVPHLQIRTETWAEKRCLPAQVVHPGAARPCRPCMRKQKRNGWEFGELEGGVPWVKGKSPDCETKISPHSRRWEWTDLFFSGHHPVQIYWWPTAGDKQCF